MMAEWRAEGKLGTQIPQSLGQNEVKSVAVESVSANDSHYVHIFFEVEVTKLNQLSIIIKLFASTDAAATEPLNQVTKKLPIQPEWHFKLKLTILSLNKHVIYIIFLILCNIVSSRVLGHMKKPVGKQCLQAKCRKRHRQYREYDSEESCEATCIGTHVKKAVANALC